MTCVELMCEQALVFRDACPPRRPGRRPQPYGHFAESSELLERTIPI
jgi:hypothetical protein